MKLRKGFLIFGCFSIALGLLAGSVAAMNASQGDNAYGTQPYGTGTDLSNIKAVNQSDISVLGLKNIILGKSDMDMKADINLDETVNALDLVYLKRNLLNNSGDGREVVKSSYSATAENVKLIGRNVIKDGVTWLVQSGSAVEFEVVGTSAEVCLAGDSSIYADEKYRTRYAVIVDGVIIEDDLMITEEKTIKVFESETSKKANVKVIHLSEANNGAIGVKEISVASSAKSPIMPVARKDLSIEFIGDSITCAYGVEGASQHEPFRTDTENFMKSYAYLTAQKLNADYSAVCYSGHGIISGYTTGEKNTGSLVPDCYSQVGKAYGYTDAWDFESNPNDVVVINLGTNDSSYLSKDFEARSGEFVEGYVSFLKTVREKNPSAYIICTVGTMGGEDVYDLIEQAMDLFKSETSDKKIMGYLSATQKPANGYGSDWHPSEITQQESAYVLADKICEALGLESDKIGLDFAENAVYDIVINQDSGANASFFVAYDKSFWINMVNGGTESSDIKACLSDINLKAGEYRLSFNYKSGVDTEIPISVGKTGGSAEPLFTDSVESVSDDKSYSDTFTVPADTENCEIAFNIGGTDYYNVTLSNIILIKIS